MANLTRAHPPPSSVRLYRARFPVPCVSRDPPRRPSQPRGLLRPIFRVSLIIYKLVLPHKPPPPFPLRISHPASYPWDGSRGSQGVAPYAVLVPHPFIMMKKRRKRNCVLDRSHAIEWMERRKEGGMSIHSFIISPIMLNFSPTGQDSSNTSSRQLSCRCSSLSFAFKPEIVFRKHDIDMSETRPSPLGWLSRVTEKKPTGSVPSVHEELVSEIKFERDGAGKSLRKEKVTEAEAEVSITAKMGWLQAGQPNVEKWEESMNTSISATFDSLAVDYRLSVRS